MIKKSILTFFALFLFGTLLFAENVTGKEYSYDVVVYGGTSAAVTTAVQVKKMGRSVVVVSPDKHLGGLTSGGLGFTDSGNVGTIGGLSREFYHRVYQEYEKDASWRWEKRNEYGNQGQGTKAMLHEDQTMWIFEPHVAEKVFDNWVAEYEIPVIREALLDRENGVKKEGTRIVSLKTLDGNVYHGRCFIDATYEGDLLASAGVSYHVGREANSVYNEKWNGNQFNVFHHGHYFKKAVDPYKIPGDPKSGRLKYIDDSEEGVNGDGDHRIQAYCFRMCLTQHPENRVPFHKPENYNREDYELLRRVFETGWNETFDKFDCIPNKKTDTNNHGPFSTDFIGMNYDYPEASYERRVEIIKEHYNYQLGWFYFIANDESVPENIRTKMSQWGLAKDEFPDNGHWPHQIYVREARRMVGEYVTTENECLGRKRPPKPVGMGSYTLDSHNVRRFVTKNGTVQNEGDIGVHPAGPYGIDYGSLTPKADECTNLLVPVCVSSSHIAFGSIRMEPVFMLLGQSAGTAAVLSLEDGVSVQQLSYEKLRARLIADGQRLQYASQPKSGSIAIETLPGLILDDFKTKMQGNWQESSARGLFVGSGYAHDQNEGKGEKTVAFSFEIENPGLYEVRISYTEDPNRATNVPVTIKHSNGTEMIFVNQRKKPPIDNLFLSLGNFQFDKTAIVTISNAKTDGFVIVDSVQILQWVKILE